MRSIEEQLVAALPRMVEATSDSTLEAGLSEHLAGDPLTARAGREAALTDAALIASAQRVEHYEIAVYGSLAAWAHQLGLEDAGMLHDVLEEQKAANAKLTELAKRSVNADAAA